MPIAAANSVDVQTFGQVGVAAWDPGNGNVIVSLHFNQVTLGTLQDYSQYLHDGVTPTPEVNLYNQGHPADANRSLAINTLAGYPTPDLLSASEQAWGVSPLRSWRFWASFSGMAGPPVLADCQITPINNSGTAAASITVPNGDAVLCYICGHSVGDGPWVYSGPASTPLQSIDTGAVSGDARLIQSDGSQINVTYTSPDVTHKTFLVLVHLKAAATAPNPPTSTVVSNPTNTTLDVTVSGGDTATSTVELYFREAGETQWDLLASLVPGYTFPYTHTDLDPATTYEYRARNVTAGGASVFGPTGSGTTLSAIMRVGHNWTDNQSQVAGVTFDPGADNVLVGVHFNQTAGAHPGGNLYEYDRFYYDGVSFDALVERRNLPNTTDGARAIGVFTLDSYTAPAAGARVERRLFASPSRNYSIWVSFNGTVTAPPQDDVHVHHMADTGTPSASITVPAGDAVMAILTGHSISDTPVYAGTAGDAIHAYHQNNLAADSYLIQSDGSPITANWTLTDVTWKGFITLIHLRSVSVPPGAPVLAAVASADNDSATVPVTAPGSDATSHQAYHSTAGPTGPWTANGDPLGPSPTTVVYVGLQEDTEHWFKLDAINTVGATASNVVSTTTATKPPTGMAVSNPTITTLDYAPSGGDVGTVDVYTEIQRLLKGTLPTFEGLWRAHTWTSGTQWDDESGNAHHATIVGGPPNSGAFFNLNGATQYFRVPHHVNFNPGETDPLTVVVVARAATPQPPENRRLVGKRGAASGWSVDNLGGADLWRAEGVGATSGLIASDVGPVLDTAPQDLVMVKDGTNRLLSTLLDGAPGGVTADNTVGGWTNTEDMAFGAAYQGGAPVAGTFFDGDLYGIGIVRGVLTATELVLVYLHLLGLAPTWTVVADHAHTVVYPQTATGLISGATYDFRARTHRQGGWYSKFGPIGSGTTAQQIFSSKTATGSMRLLVGGEYTGPASVNILVGGEHTAPASVNIDVGTSGAERSIPASMNIVIPDILPKSGVGVPMTPN